LPEEQASPSFFRLAHRRRKTQTFDPFPLLGHAAAWMPEPLLAHRFATGALALGQAAGGFFALLVVHSYQSFACRLAA
jgi:hypothetical protein